MRFFFLLYTVFFLSPAQAQTTGKRTFHQGAVVRGDSTKREVALVFTADATGEGLSHIRKTLQKEKLKGGFFFTGRFYRDPGFQKEIRRLARDGHYVGPHSDQHLLYCDWQKRDSLLVTNDSFRIDMVHNLEAMKKAKLPVSKPQLFIPPFEWWNNSIAQWSAAEGLQLLSFTPGIRTNVDYTWPELGTAYKSSEWILNWLRENLATNANLFNGAIVLIHAGTDQRRRDKLYNRLAEIIRSFKAAGFQLKRIDELLQSR